MGVLLRLFAFLINLAIILLDFMTWCDDVFAFLVGIGGLFSLEAAVVVAEGLLGECNHFRLDLLEDVPDDWFGVEAGDLVVELSALVVDGGVGEGGDLEFLAQAGVPVAVEVVDGEGPVLLVLELVEDVLQVAAVHAVGREELHYLVGVPPHRLPKLPLADQSRVSHEPLLASHHRKHHCQQHPPHPPFIIHSCRINVPRAVLQRVIDISGAAVPTCPPPASSPAASPPPARLCPCLSC